MKITVDQARCQGHALCALGAPELFELSMEDGHARPAHDTVPADRHDAAVRAELDCPERAISLVDTDGDNYTPQRYPAGRYE